MRKTPQLYRVEHNGQISEEISREFEFHLQNALLLALQEAGRLDEIQCRWARDRLRSQHKLRPDGPSDTGAVP